MLKDELQIRDSKFILINVLHVYSFCHRKIWNNNFNYVWVLYQINPLLFLLLRCDEFIKLHCLWFSVNSNSVDTLKRIMTSFFLIINYVKWVLFRKRIIVKWGFCRTCTWTCIKVHFSSFWLFHVSLFLSTVYHISSMLAYLQLIGRSWVIVSCA